MRLSNIFLTLLLAPAGSPRLQTSAAMASSAAPQRPQAEAVPAVIIVIWPEASLAAPPR
jgi:hypothetical protein